jgi:catalase
LALTFPTKPEVRTSGALSLFSRPGDIGIRPRRIAILVASGVSSASSIALHAALSEHGAIPRYVAARLGAVETADGETIEAEVTLEAAPAVLFDALVLPDGEAAVEFLAADGQALEFLKDQYRHCKAMLAIGSAAALLEDAQIPPTTLSGEDNPGLLRFESEDAENAVEAFVAAIAKHRHFERQTDPPVL